MLHDERRTRRGFGRLRQLPSGRWQAAYTGPDAVLYKHPTTFPTEDAARGWLADERKLIDLDAWTSPAERARAKKQRGQTFTEYAEQWLETRTTRDSRPLKPRTVAEYRRYLDRHLSPALGYLPVRAITEQRVRDWWNDMADTATNERVHSYQLLRAIMTSATKDKIVPANPCTVDGAGHVRRSRKIRIATVDELSAIAEAMPERLRLAVLLGAWCAMRWGEIAELRRQDVKITRKGGQDAATIDVQRGVTRAEGAYHEGDPKSSAGVRVVHVPPHLIPAVRDHLANHTGAAPTALLFPNETGGHLHARTFGKRFDAAREAAGRPDLHFHDLRHTGAVLAAQSGATIADLMARLGHSTPRMAMIYQHTAEGRDAMIAEALSRAATPKRSRRESRSDNDCDHL